MTDSTIESNVRLDSSELPARLRSELSRFAGGGPAWVAYAPDTMDVMGGIAEYTGSVALCSSADCGVWVAAIPRDDQRICVIDLNSSQLNNGRETVWPLAGFYEAADRLAPAAAIRQMAAGMSCRNRLACLSVIYAMLEGGCVPHLGGGFTLLIECQTPGVTDHRRAAAVQAATIAALARAFGVELDESKCACVAQRGQHAIAKFPSGIATHAAPFVGKGGTLAQVDCQPYGLNGVLDLPAGVAVLGIESGARHRRADGKYIDARTAAFMGREIIKRIITASGRGASEWNGYLARFSITDYVDHFRDRLPTKVKGSLYLERFGPLNEVLAEIDPDAVYKVRSRAEHHIYEHERVRQFTEKMRRAARMSDPVPVVEAGELMYASHWSYGQRCGLGSIETDLLVNLLRKEGVAEGIFGARVSGAGAGGMVVVLLRDDERARQAVERSADAYQDRTGRTPHLMPAAGPGAPGLTVERFS